MKPKLVKNTKVVKLPRARRDVKSTLRRAMIHAEKEGWNKVIILGEGKDISRSLYSKMDSYTIIGMLDTDKAVTIMGMLDN